MRPLLVKLILTLLLPITIFGQETPEIEVELTIQQKVRDQITTFPHAELMISNIGKIKTDEQGRYFFNYPVEDPERDPLVGIQVLSDMHQLLQPLDGAVELNVSEDKVKLEFLIHCYLIEFH